MQVFEYAKKMELDGINFYKREAEKTTKSGFKRILELLIHEERKHYAFLEELENNCPAAKLETLALDRAENIFQEMRKNKEGFDFSEDQVEAYRKALEIERKSEKFYRDLAEKQKNPEIKKQLLMVAEEEKKHVIMVDGLVEYIDRPNQWVEHAMFSQLREAY
jgi:rubrerythrin